MTRKDYELLARVMRDRRNSYALMGALSWTEEEVKTAIDTHADIVKHLANELGADNIRFDKQRFIKDCGVLND